VTRISGRYVAIAERFGPVVGPNQSA
jgi:hypothetical protein